MLTCSEASNAMLGVGGRGGHNNLPNCLDIMKYYILNVNPLNNKFSIYVEYWWIVRGFLPPCGHQSVMQYCSLFWRKQLIVFRSYADESVRLDAVRWVRAQGHRWEAAQESLCRPLAARRHNCNARRCNRTQLPPARCVIPNRGKYERAGFVPWGKRRVCIWTRWDKFSRFSPRNVTKTFI